MKTVLYLDKTNEEIEKLLKSHESSDLKFKFLSPICGEQGFIEEADYIITTNVQVTKEVIDAAPNLKLIARAGVGFDNVDIKYARVKGIDVTIAQAANAVSVAELVILLMLDCYRKVYLLDVSTKNGKWESWKYRHESFELAGKTIGILGAGTIGKEVAKRLSSFNVNIIYYNRKRLKEREERELNMAYHNLEEFLKLADMVSVHVPLTEGTEGLIGKKELALMKDSAFIINTSRGPIIDEDALIWALDKKEIAGAALDVFTKNPPEKNSQLLAMPNVIATPHIAGATIDAYKRIFAISVENIQRKEQGEAPLFVVNS